MALERLTGRAAPVYDAAPDSGALRADLVHKYGGSIDGTGTDSPVLQREEYLTNLADLRERILDMQGKNQDVLERIAVFVTARNEDARHELATMPKHSLGEHLRDIRLFAEHFLYTPGGEPRIRAEYIHPRHAWLLAKVVAPLHDMLKYLGARGSQIPRDHELQTASLVRDAFVGTTVAGQVLNDKDVEFIARIIEDHENLMREESHARYGTSSDMYERGKALFFILDTLTGALVEKNGVWHIDNELLRMRFSDLYARHVYSHKRKIFRPEWGVATVRDLSNTLRELGRHGLRLGEGELRKLWDAAENVLVTALTMPVLSEPKNGVDCLLRYTKEGEVVDEPQKVQKALEELRQIRPR